MLRVEVTKHVERLFERFPKYKSFDARTVANVLENVIKNGVIVKLGNELRISTSNYTLCCALEEKLVIKTILRTKELLVIDYSSWYYFFYLCYFLVGVPFSFSLIIHFIAFSSSFT